MGKFLDIYNKLNEIKKETLLKNTDSGRVKRGTKDIITRGPKITDENGITRYHYNFKTKPSVEGKRHWGYVDVDEKDGDIKKVWCDCKDFSYRLWAPYVKRRLSNWSLPNKYQKRMPFDHNHDWTKETNPNGKIYVCKHLYALLQHYL